MIKQVGATYWKDERRGVRTSKLLKKIIVGAGILILIFALITTASGFL